MIKFLKSIGIDNHEDYDMSFKLITKNVFNKDQFDMYISKDTPWEYSKLEVFLRSLSLIEYPYELTFSYEKNPSIEDVYELFLNWYQGYARSKFDFTIVKEPNGLVIVFENVQQQTKNYRIINDFQGFLKFLNYDFSIKEQLKNINIEESNAQVDNCIKVENNKNTHQDSTMDGDEEEIIATIKENLKDESNKYSKKSFGDYNYFDNWKDIDIHSEAVEIHGQIFGVDTSRLTSSGKMTLNCFIGNKEDVFKLRLMERPGLSGDVISNLKSGIIASVKGLVEQNRYTRELYISVYKIEQLPSKELRTDNSEGKRVELHLHTKMSTMDGIGTMEEYCSLAKNMGHNSIAITDHGVVQGFPSAQAAGKKYGLKILYGSELYMVDDNLPYILNPKNIPLNKATYVVFDLETTGLSTRYDRIIEFGAIKFKDGHVIDSIDLFIDPERKIPDTVVSLTGITQDMVNNKPTFEQSCKKILDFIGDSILVSHNIIFDFGFLNESLRRMGLNALENGCVDTLSLSRYLFPEARLHRLGTLAKNLDITSYNEDEAHRADFDAKVLNEIWMAMLNRLCENNQNLLHCDLLNIKGSNAMLKHLRPTHIVALAKNSEGLRDLYTLISKSHTDYFALVPKTPKREISQLRKNLLLGSGCFNGEIFDIARTQSRQHLVRAMSFYDYIEIQPIDNYSYLLNRKSVETKEEIIKILKDIIEVADELNKIVVATGDAHYANKEDKFTRDVLISAKGVGQRFHPLYIDKRHTNNIVCSNPDQHFRSTEEMLECFNFLNKDKAYEIVVTNTNKIADMIESLTPIKTDLFAPVIDEAPTVLRNLCYDRARSLYGEQLPQTISDRLEKELNGIIGSGYSVTYYIAHKIVKEANDHGYVVGSRGSVGSSFVATMAGITEVNPLKPHYRCPKCKHYEEDETGMYKSGYDLPDKKCPHCKTKMYGDGQNIPFETFLGFDANKIPDIDLNFPSDYQSKAFDYTKVFFGENNVFRAGTIETVKDKTAFGYVRGYYESIGVNPDSINRNTIAYKASFLTGVKRTTGQHPGGIMVLPKGLSIYDFSPIQYPADDLDSSWLTTHLDYHSLHDSLLKLDLLGHIDPLALKMMTELTGINIDDIPLNDKKVLSIFTSIKSLKMSSNYLDTKIGALGIPEFGTSTGFSILADASPKLFSDLVIISGLSHGTDVWMGNAQRLIKNNTCTLNEVIGCRDDIMTYLIDKGLDKKIAFLIMEDVRKGKKLKPDYEKLMRDKNVPEWYISSCNKIKYMFPKAHAVAYVTMAVRVGYFKVYYPLEFYAVWFSARCKQYDIKALVGGKDAIFAKYDALNKIALSKNEKLSPKDEEILKSLTVAIEMVQRGFSFANVDINKSDATTFLIDKENNQLIPPFIVIDGLGEAAAYSVVEARKDGEFTSQENLLKRTKLNSTNVEELANLGSLGNMGETEQMSLFDFGLDF